MHRLALLFLSALALTGCITTRIIERPAINDVKKVAIVSVYSNYAINHVGGSSSTGESQGVASMFAGKKDKDVAKEGVGFGRTTLVEFAEKDLRDDLSKVHGWQVVDPKTFVDRPDFKKWVAENDQKKGAEKLMFFETTTRHPKLAKVQVSKNDKERIADLKALAQKLGVDAVAVCALAINYDTSSGIGSTGTALAVVSPHLMVVNKAGDVAVADMGSGKFRSSTTVGMVAGSIIFNDKSEGMFKEAITTALAHYPTKINTDLDETK